MRVCLVGPAYPYRGGIAHFTAMLAREFRKDHEVLLVNFSRMYPSFLFPGKTQYDESPSALRVDSKRVVDSVNPLSWRAAARVIVDFRPAIVVFQWWHPFFGPAFRIISSAVKRRTDARIIFLCHNVLPHESSIFDRTLVGMGLGSADAYLVQSREDERNLKRLKRDARVAVNPLPTFDLFEHGRFDRESARAHLELEGPTLLFFGYIRPYKGLGVLLEGFGRVLQRMSAMLLVVGEFYEKRENYDEVIERLSIGPHVRIVDSYVPNAEVEAYFKAADLVVLPYLSATQSAIVQTAFSFAKPVVVTAVGGLPEVVEDGVTGYVVPPRDPQALANAVVRFFEEKAAERMASAIESGRDRFSWKRCVEVLTSLAK